MLVLQIAPREPYRSRNRRLPDAHAVMALEPCRNGSQNLYGLLRTRLGDFELRELTYEVWIALFDLSEAVRSGSTEQPNLVALREHTQQFGHGVEGAACSKQLLQRRHHQNRTLTPVRQAHQQLLRSLLDLAAQPRPE
jgi:hypothetical protein